jgi:hypothetical protein
MRALHACLRVRCASWQSRACHRQSHSRQTAAGGCPGHQVQGVASSKLASSFAGSKTLGKAFGLSPAVARTGETMRSRSRNRDRDEAQRYLWKAEALAETAAGHALLRQCECGARASQRPKRGDGRWGRGGVAELMWGGALDAVNEKIPSSGGADGAPKSAKDRWRAGAKAAKKQVFHEDLINMYHLRNTITMIRSLDWLRFTYVFENRSA